MTENLHPHNWQKFEWLDVTQPTHAELTALAEQYNLPAHTVEDCLEPDHLPKYEVVDGQGFIITRTFAPRDNFADTIQDLSSKVAVFFDDKRLITIHRLPQPFLAKIRDERLRPDGCERTNELVCRIVDAVLHSFLPPAEALEKEIDGYESAIFLNRRMPDLQQKLYFLKRRASVARKIIGLTEEVVTTLEKRFGTGQAQEELWDTFTKAETRYEQILEDAHNLTNVYLALSAQRTNEVMRVLTIFSVFFMPLTFIAGIYGMNFEFMPELHWAFGYPAVWLLMLGVSALILLWFWRKRWL